jgi:4-hydroxybenzoate polyprenyltransferase
VRATLHDELMREAGFESEYDVALTRQRDRRRRLARSALSWTPALALFLGGVASGLAFLVGLDWISWFLGVGTAVVVGFFKRLRKAR